MSDVPLDGMVEPGFEAVFASFERGLSKSELGAAVCAQAGKERITVRMVLSHQAGLTYPTVRVRPEQRFDWEAMTDALARSAPVWEPGSRSDYHGGTFGYLVGEILRRIDGRSLDALFR